MYSALCAFITNAAICACFAPLLLLGLKKVRQLSTFWVLGIYWSLNGLVDLRTLSPIRGKALHEFLLRLSDYYDLADVPLVLLIFAMAGAGKWRRRLLLAMLAYIAGELALIILEGYSHAWPVVIGVGVSLIVAFSIVGLWRYLKEMEHDRFENAMAYIYGAFLFVYGTYLIIYLFYYLRTSKTAYSDTDSSLLYYTSLLLSVGITCVGIGSYGWQDGRKYPNRRYSSSSS